MAMSIVQNLQPYTGNGDVSIWEKFSSGTIIPKQTNKQTNKNSNSVNSYLDFTAPEIILLVKKLNVL